LGVAAGEDGAAPDKLGEDAPHGPDVKRLGVTPPPHDHLGGAVPVWRRGRKARRRTHKQTNRDEEKAEGKNGTREKKARVGQWGNERGWTEGRE